MEGEQRSGASSTTGCDAAEGKMADTVTYFPLTDFSGAPYGLARMTRSEHGLMIESYDAVTDSWRPANALYGLLTGIGGDIPPDPAGADEAERIRSAFRAKVGRAKSSE